MEPQQHEGGTRQSQEALRTRTKKQVLGFRGLGILGLGVQGLRVEGCLEFRVDG